MNDLPELYRSVATGFDTEIDDADELTLDDVRAFVRRHIIRLLDENPGMLMSILYRIDVSEAKVHDVLNTTPQDRIPDCLADLIVQRQLQKIRTRRMYREES